MKDEGFQLTVGIRLERAATLTDLTMMGSSDLCYATTYVQGLVGSGDVDDDGCDSS